MIKNRNKLISNGETENDRKARSLALDALEDALKASDPREIIKSKIMLEGENLLINGEIQHIASFKRILVVGAGKAVGNMAEELDRILGDRISGGIIMIPRGLEKLNLRRVETVETSHPFPDKKGVEGAQNIEKLVREAGIDDLIITLISGGGSSLLPLPAENISLEEKSKVSMDLMKAGSNINELNIVRKHLSGLKGGWMAKKAHPSTLFSLILSDVVGDPLESIASGPTTPDPSTFKDATTILKRYNVWNSSTENVRRRMISGENGDLLETPKRDDECFNLVKNFIIGGNRDPCKAAQEKLEKQVDVHFLTSFLEGEARHVGTFLGAMILESKHRRSKNVRGEAYIAGGETTVTVKGNGKGGRNMEVSLGTALKIHGVDGVALCSMGTDGIDGFTEAAGGICDGKTLLRGKKLGTSILDHLVNNDSYTYLRNLNDNIQTGPTGTNLNDICIAVVV